MDLGLGGRRETNGFCVFQIGVDAGDDDTGFDREQFNANQRTRAQASMTTPLSRMRSTTSARLVDAMVFSTAMSLSSGCMRSVDHRHESTVAAAGLAGWNIWPARGFPSRRLGARILVRSIAVAEAFAVDPFAGTAAC